MKQQTNYSRLIACSLVVVIFMTFLGSVKKDNDNVMSGNYFMRFKVDGNLVEFSDQLLLTGAFGQSGGQYNGAFTGASIATNSNIGLQVFDNKPIEEISYIDYAIVGSQFVGAIIGYLDNNGNLYIQGTPAPDVTITIKEPTSDYVRGTFSGTLEKASLPDISITEGEFLVGRIN